MTKIYIESEAHNLKELVICYPKKEYFYVNNKKAHNITELANKEKSLKQRQYISEIIKNFGANV